MRALLLIGLSFFSASVFAQEYIDLGSIYYTTSPKTNYENGAESDAIDEWNLNVDIPLILNDNKILLSGFIGNKIGASLDPDNATPVSLYALTLKLGINVRYSDKWSATYMLLPKIASDFTNGLTTGYQWGFLGLATRTKSDQLKYSYGLYTNTEAYGLLVLPLVGGYYLSENKRWEVKALLPIQADINYQIRPKLKGGLRFDGLGTSYRIANDTYTDHYVNRASNELMAYLQYKLAPSLHLKMKAGYAFFRAHKVYAKEDTIDISIGSIFFGDNRTVLNTDITDSFQGGLELIYRLEFARK